VAREVASAVCGAGGDFPKGWGGSLEAINKIDRARMIINHNDINNYVNYV
jgi:hypothetical protein